MHTDWTLFFGRFHPLIVHLPIGIMFFAGLLNFVPAFRKNPLIENIIRTALLAGWLSALMAILSGYFLGSNSSYNADTLFWHQWIGIALFLLSFLAWLMYLEKSSNYFLRLRSWLLASCLLLLILGSHLGATMTHGAGYLTRYLPPFMKPAPTGQHGILDKKNFILDSVVVFKDIIQPILTKHCVNCHNADRKKGDLDLSSPEGISKGGSSGNTIVAGDPSKSELLHRVLLSPDHFKFMPAANGQPLSPVEIDLIQWWIQNGADYKNNVTSAGIDGRSKFLFAAWLGIEEEDDKVIHLPEVKPADSNLVNQLRKLNVIIHPLQSGSNLLEASLVMLQNGGRVQLNDVLSKMQGIAAQLYRLNLSHCHLTKEEVSLVANFSRLDKLDIQNNDLNDEMIEPLITLVNLTLLNAGQNQLTDKSIATFRGMQALKKINLWQTQITETGQKELSEKIIGIAIEK